MSYPAAGISLSKEKKYATHRDIDYMRKYKHKRKTLIVPNSKRLDKANNFWLEKLNENTSHHHHIQSIKYSLSKMVR